MKIYSNPSARNIKFALIFLGLIIGAGTLLYTNSLVKTLQDREKQVIQLFANGLEYIANSAEDYSDITFLMENIIQPINFEVILTDKDNNINLESKADFRNVKFDSTLSTEQLKDFFANKIIEIDAINKPIDVKYISETDTLILTKIHYGESELITKLKYYPYVLISVATVFILLGYLSFSQIKRTEQSNIWVGMAKETAHQFGTPISSLMGWIELLRINYNDPDKVLDTAEEISNDVEKLNKITNRFSKIGSKADLKPENLLNCLERITDYFKRRLPRIGKMVDLRLECDEKIVAMMNTELFEWVIENLIKNSLDAIEHENGIISISAKEIRNNIEIEVSDNGKGIDTKRRKDVFRPGYSTKKRGWGLGLSLSKRIVEDYHKGKIMVKSSAAGEGTTFKIIINKQV
ncbi:MAG: HAMP domain-containing histidine kinase [Ignavibacteriaceae bacterium]|nr:HAMP domain-containing histidine kinase [Ignavibacteriaceae bacterium]